MKKTTIALALLAAITAPSAFAYEKGDWIVRGGLTNVAPDASSSPILAGSLDLGQALPSVGTSLTVDVDNNTQLGLNLAYFVSDQINVEVLAATPFKHDIEFAAGTLAETSHLPPTVTVNYFFNDPAAKFQPYAGVGVNYTIFFDEDFKDGAVTTIEALTQADLGAPATVSNLELDASFGLSAQIGFDYMLEDGWLINASIRYIDIETEATFDIGGVPAVATRGTIETVDIDPYVYTLSVGYKF
ncbi:OmpW family outer membrane protein [Alteromonas sp. ASW11-36]|uniref:OmpW family outer membrane protein n=1 Tax=Alteromonas arenosi TaxID=3055817 RepID=A0ABT7STP6_9ALTE|nr:OmpW family outer membrane protein [Alteromonas sp. ASW11-36]MDM7859369.1 OmpW family outer membrane protein [Alteromonas sp. ASW11-36]